MNKFEPYKQALGPLAITIPDDELRRNMKLHELMAETLFDMWMKEIKRKRWLERYDEEFAAAGKG